MLSFDSHVEIRARKFERSKAEKFRSALSSALLIFGQKFRDSKHQQVATSRLQYPN